MVDVQFLWLFFFSKTLVARACAAMSCSHFSFRVYFGISHDNLNIEYILEGQY